MSRKGPSFAGEKGKKLRILEATEPIAPVIFPIEPFIPSAILVTIYRPACKNLPAIPVIMFNAPVIPERIALLTPFIAPVTIPRNELNTLLITFLIAFTTLVIMLRIVFQTLVIIERIPFIMLEITLLIALNTDVTILRIAFTAVEIMFLILFQMFWIVLLMLLNMFFA